MSDTETIAELFSRSSDNPESLSRADLQRIIDYYREKRTQYKTSGTAVTPLAKPRPSLDELFPS